MAGQEGASPGPESTIEEKLLFLQGNMVSFISQYSMPIIEVSLVVSKFLKAISDSLEKNAAEHGEEIPKYLTRVRPARAMMSLRAGTTWMSLP